MALPVYVSDSFSTLASGSGVTSAPFTEPSGAASNDHFLLEVSWFNTATSAAVSGWSSIGTAYQASSGMRTAWFVVKRGVSAPSLTVTFSGGSAMWSYARCIAYRGAFALEAVGTITEATGFSTSHASAAASTAFSDSMAIAMGAVYTGALTAASAGWTFRAGTFAEKALTTPSSSGVATFTSSLAASASTVTVVLASVTVPAPIWLVRPSVSGTPGVGNVLTVSGSALYAYSYTYAWRRFDGATITTVGTGTQYTQTSSDSKCTLWCEVTALGGGGSTLSKSLGTSFYTLVGADVGHSITAEVTSTNTAGASTAVATAGTAIQFQNSTPPSISGGSPTMTAGVVLTAVAGTYVETVTGRTYQWLADGVQVATGTTFTPGEEYGSRRITVRENVTGPSGTGTATSTDKRWFPSMKLVGKTAGNPWYVEVPADVALDPTWTSTWQGYLTSSYGSGGFWWYNGGDHGASYSGYINVVDSSMPRTPFDLVPTYGGAIKTPVKNGDQQEHLAWSFKTKNGGVPTPPDGFKVAGGSDKSMIVYCHDTGEVWGTWVTELPSGGVGITGWPTLPRFEWGGYIADFAQFDGFFKDLTITPGTTDEKQYQTWGESAAGPVMPGMPQQIELFAGAIEHAIGIEMPGNNHTARYPVTRIETNVTNVMPLGGIIRIDPTFNLSNPANLSPSTLGSTAADNFRYAILRAFQKYGGFVIDTAFSVAAAIRIESVDNYLDAYQNPANFDTIMKSVPTTAWQVVSDQYRPAGGPTPPALPKLSTYRFTDQYMDTFGATMENKRLTINCAFGGICYVLQVGDFTDDTVYVRLQNPASTVSFRIRANGPDDGNNQIDFNISATQIGLRARYLGAVVGADTTLTYSAVNHAWLRFVHNSGAGTNPWDTAPDVAGVPGAWTTRRTLTVPGSFWTINNCSQAYYAPSGGSGSAVFATMNEVPAPVEVSPGWVVGVA